jgi:hypothetical protein
MFNETQQNTSIEAIDKKDQHLRGDKAWKS